MFISIVIIALRFVPYFFDLGIINRDLLVSDIAMLVASFTLISSLILYLWTPKKGTFMGSFAVYLLLLATSTALLYKSGGGTSPFVALWIVVAVFASVFGWWGSIAVVLVGAGYSAYLVLVQDTLPINEIITTAIVVFIPLIASYIIFHVKPRKDLTDTSTYYELASELSQVTNKSETVIRAIDDGVLALDSRGNIELMNPAAQRIIGWGNNDALGLSYKSVLKLSDSKDQPVTEANDPVAQVLATNHDIDTKDFYATTESGKKIILSLVISPVGQIGEGVIVAFRDITKGKMEERGQAEFISTASHEMRTPVASIEGYLGLALNPNTAQIDDKARDFIEKAHASAQHLGRLFQDLLDVSKADDGRLSNHPKVVDIVDYTAEIVEGLRPKAEEKQLRLYYKPLIDDADTTRSISPVFYANVDNDHLREVIANLVENAIKYTPKGDVIVDVTGDQDHVTISIQDSGIGIPLEDIPHLFQKFYRVDNSATREIGGTGLGLYLCRRLAEIMGGRIWLESEFQKGSTFHLELPRLDREDALRMLDAAASEITTIDEPAVIASPPRSLASQPQSEAPSTSVPPVIQQPQVVSQPIPQAAPTMPIPQQPIAVQPQVVAPAPAQVFSQPTIASIEQNSAQYVAPRSQSSIKIPVREHLQSPEV